MGSPGMNRLTKNPMEKRPRIILTSLDLDRLEALLEALPAAIFPGKIELRAELDRAEVVAHAGRASPTW